MNKKIYSISILIPIFNAPYRLRDLFITLESNTNKNLLTEIILGDDHSDTLTQSLINKIIANSLFNIKVIRHIKNIGYLKNANAIYAAAKGDIIILLNTDTLVPPNWLERVQGSFQHDSNIVLATPFATHAATLTVLPNIGQSWLDVDRCISTLTPHYPDAHTAVGFFLAIRKDILSQQKSFEGELFDEIYHPGYGEETDLHYRVLEKGFRSIVIDNLLVHHANGSSSFSLKSNLHEILKKNEKIFYEKWGSQHEKINENFIQTKPYDHLQGIDNYFLFKEKNRAIDILFVLPAFISKIGGINVAVDLAKYLSMNNINSSIYCYGHVDETQINLLGFFNPWRSLDEIKKHVSNISVICATSYSSTEHAKEIAGYYDAKIIYLVQGPETLFVSGKYFGKTLNDYLNNNLKIICVSHFLFKYLKQLGVNNHICIPLGAETYEFYHTKNNKKRNIKSIAACLRASESKGSGIMLHALLLAKKSNFDIHLFGKESEFFDLPENFGYYHGDLTTTALKKLFNEVGYYLDLSYFEGLGLLPLEAANCGAIPIVSHNGGSDGIFTNKQDAFFIDNIFIQDNFFDVLINKSDKETYEIRQNTLKISNDFSMQQARESFINHLQKMIKIEQKPIIINDNIMIEKINNIMIEEKNSVIVEEISSIMIEEKSSVVVEEKSSVVVEEKSSVVVEEKSSVVVEEKSSVVVEEKSSVVVEEISSVMIEEISNQPGALEKKSWIYKIYSIYENLSNKLS